MANNDNSDYFANWNRFAGYQQVQPQYKTSRFAFAPVYGSFNESHYFSGRAPIAQMTPAPGQVPGSSMLETYPITHQTTGYHDISGPTDASAPNSPSDSPDSPTSTASSRTVVESPTKRGGREAYEGAPPILFNYPAVYDAPPPDEPRHIPAPDDVTLARALHPHDRAQVNSDYMGFIVVMERLWSRLLRVRFERFCREQGPLMIRKEVVEAEVEKVMWRWAAKSFVRRQFPHVMQEVRDFAHVEYEWRVRVCHVEKHLEEYKTSTVLRLRKLGYLIGG
ncbi:MAG: hypothetical protein L6R36_004705 [Xanthoria steineri]|nr:MAG: hypothetical protein L6R36_004705 [Xanthoria steineri]